MTTSPLPPTRRTLLAALGLAACLLPAANAATDYNNNGYDDIWEHRYNILGVPNHPYDSDRDGDGATNLMESIAGTSPDNPQDVLKIQEITLTGSNLLISLKTHAGKRYVLESSGTPDGPVWTAEGSPLTGTGTLQSFTIPAGSGTAPKFFRVTASDVDTDGDGVSDWAEALMGTNPTLATSPSNASGGAAPDGEVLRSLVSFTATVVTPSSYEKEGTRAVVRLTRTYGSMPLTLRYSAAGNTDSTRGSASSGDYLLKNSSNTTLNSTGFQFPANTSQFDVQVAPTLDSLNEVPEMLRLTFRATSGSVNSPLGTTQTVDIRDATNTQANRRLFVAYLGREGGAVTTATGLATLLLNGDNTQAEVNSSFSNLTSPQSASHLHAAPVGDPLASGPIIESLELGQLTGRTVSIDPEPAGGWTTAQATLTALFDGFLYINVHTANYGAGEIRGNFALANGSVAEPPVPAAPPAYGSPEWPALTGAALDRDIARFLTQATYGPTAESIQEVKDLITANGGNALAGYTAWINKQMDLTQTPSPNFTRLVQAADMEEFFLRGNKPINWRNAPWFGDGGSRWNGSSWVQDTGIKSVNYTDNYNRRREWWTLVLQSRDQLRQRMALALSEIVVVAETDLNIRSIHYGMANYWDLLAGNAFSRYRKVLGDVTQNPMMAHYLSYLKNARASGNILPDENYAREVMQLFSVGLVNRHLDGTLKLGNDGLPLPTYDQNDIREMARVFTGFGYSKLHANILAPLYPNPGYLQMGPLQDNSSFTASASLFSYYWQGPWIEPLKLFDAYHDFNAKTLFNGKTGQVALPAKTNSATESEGLADVNDALDALAGKDSPSAAYDGHPNTPVFISRLLIQRFTTSNPSAGYLYRVATTFKNTSGNLGEVIKAILLDHEARSIALADGSVAVGKIKEPLLHLTNLLRALKCYTGLPLVHLTTVPLNFTSLESPVTEPYPLSEYNKFPPGAVRFRFYETTFGITQSAQRAPSVFNWFLPDFSPPGPLPRVGMVAPEMQTATESSVVNFANTIHGLSLGSNPPTHSSPGSGLEDLPSLLAYRNASGVQFTLPQWAVDKGYFTATQFTPGTNQPASLYKQVDNLVPRFDDLVSLYTSTYTTALAAQYAPAAVPVTPGTTEKSAAHAEAVKAVVDQLDLLLASGSLRATTASSPGGHPRTAILDSLNAIAANNRHTTDATNFAADALTRVKNAVYLVMTSPEGLVLK